MKRSTSKKVSLAAALAVGVALTSAPWIAQAHHSAARFDLSIRDNYVTGIVKEFHAANPHTKIVLEVTDKKGTRDIEYEGHSLNNYYRAGWRDGLVNDVRIVSAMAMSTSVSNGDLPSCPAISPTARPAKAAVSGVNVSTSCRSCHLERCRMVAVPSAEQRSISR